MPLDQLTYEPDDEILSTLIRADGLIPSPEKWWRGGNYKAGTNCAITALHDAAGAETVSGERLRWAAWTYLVQALPDIFGACIMTFNDAPETTFDDIKSLYARAENLRRAELRERVA